MTPPSDREILARRTVERASEALHGSASSALPEIIQLVHTLAQKSEIVSLQELADLIKRDPTVLAKVLQIANTTGYRPGGRVTTVVEAIQAIGFERIRSITTALLLLEQASRIPSEEQRETTARALTAGFVAQTVAADYGSQLEPEHAYIAAVLRHFGGIVMSTFLREDYLSAQALAKTIDEDAAFETVFGLTPLGLGHELLRKEGLPPAIVEALRPFDPRQADQSGGQRLLAVGDFATRFSALILAGHVGAEEFARRSSALAADFAGVLPGLGSQLGDILHTAQQQLGGLRRSLGVRSLPVSVLDRLQHRIARKNPPEATPPVTGAAPPPENAATAAPSPGPAGEPVGDAGKASPTVADDVLGAGLVQLRELAVRGAGSEVINFTLLDILRRAFGAADTMLLLPRGGPGGAEGLGLAFGLGDSWLALQPHARVVAGERTVCGLCFTRREIIVVHDATEANIRRHLPEWLRSPQAPHAFALMPLHSGPGETRGLVLVGWPHPRHIALAAEQTRRLHELLALGRTGQSRPAMDG